MNKLILSIAIAMIILVGTVIAVDIVYPKISSTQLTFDSSTVVSANKGSGTETNLDLQDVQNKLKNVYLENITCPSGSNKCTFIIKNKDRIVTWIQIDIENLSSKDIVTKRDQLANEFLTKWVTQTNNLATQKINIGGSGKIVFS